MTLDELAERSELSASEISKLELGVRPLRYEHLKRLADAMGVQPQELVYRDQIAEVFASEPAQAQEGSPSPSLPVFGRVKGDRLVDVDRAVGTFDWSGYQDASELFVVPMPAGELAVQAAFLVVSRTAPVRTGDLVLRRSGSDVAVEVLGTDRTAKDCSKVVAVWLK